MGVAAQQFLQSLQSLQFDVDPTVVVNLLGAAKQQMVEIARAVLHNAKVIIFDEPTASLTPEEKKYFFALVFNLQARGVSFIFISNALEEALLLAKSRGKRPLVSRTEAANVGTEWIKLLNIRAISKDVKAIELSGGNQQKVVIAKSLIQEPELIIFDEPTRGVDVDAITEIHELINRLSDEGKAVVVISSYLPEVMALSDRILVQRMGKVVEEYSALEATEEKIMYAAIH